MATDTAQRPTAKDAGCWVDGARGIYMGERVIFLARQWGWEPDMSEWSEKDFTPDADDPEIYDAAIDAAEEYLNTIAPEGYYFGFDGDGAGFGLWARDEFGICIGEEILTDAPVLWRAAGEQEPRIFDCAFAAEKFGKGLQAEGRISPGWYVRHAVTGERID